MIKAVRNAFSFGTDLWDPSSRFETSWLFPPLVLFAFRTIIGLYILITRLLIIGKTCASDTGCAPVRNEFSYFTVLTYWGLTFYFIVASLHTLTYALTTRPLLDRFPRPLQALHSLFYTTVVTYPFLVTIVYWAILYDGPWYTVTYNGWKEISQHGLNSAFALFEVAFPRTAPPPWIHILWLIIILALYLALAYITHATKGFYPYDFLDSGPDGPGGPGWVAVYIICILVAVIVIFVVVKAIIWFRVWVTERKMHMDGKFAHQRRTEHDPEIDVGQK
ncbi:hypothetical protein SAPIO_CDS5542 [Scedosporium apiospermum]|uniref:FAR-17a/AIG1-like protein n=1 Tax=Pseudallescheria apiosperma TaxID=563466 RepID=A0A084G4V4_PSEDA|nr:uncharacterized protein SAPIO_CDS5542 [Scedosporium apiospermum]KEZ42366.1 hypothetical protein SAPIO_CDS5542 [Scedosporium apiospermum]